MDIALCAAYLERFNEKWKVWIWSPRGYKEPRVSVLQAWMSALSTEILYKFQKPQSGHYTLCRQSQQARFSWGDVDKTSLLWRIPKSLGFEMDLCHRKSSTSGAQGLHCKNRLESVRAGQGIFKSTRMHWESCISYSQYPIFHNKQLSLRCFNAPHLPREVVT